MTGPNSSLEEQAAATRQLVQAAGKLWIAAAEKSDSAEGLGIDGRISLVHGLVDVWVKSYIAWLEAFITGGGIVPWPTQPDDVPLPSEVIEVDSRDYPRKIENDGPFVRIGLPTVTISPPAFAFDPPFLPAGVTTFRIVLKDHRFIGSNFTGKIRLTSTSTKVAPDEKAINVGL